MNLETFELGESPQIIERRVLDNGLVLLTNQKKGLEGKVYINVGVNLGSRDERDEDSGISHHTEHSIFRGTDDYSGVAVLKEIEDLGGEWDAATDHDNTTFGIDIEKGNVAKALKVLRSVLFEPKFGPRNVDKEKSIILQEIADDEHDYDVVLEELFLKTLYEKHPLRRPILGTRETVAVISRESLIEYHNRFYVPKNMVLCIVGDFEPTSIDETIRLFGEINGGEFNKRKDLKELKQESKFEEKLITDSEWHSYRIGAKLTDGQEIVHTFHPDIYVMALINYLLVAGEDSKIRRSGRINDKVREKGAKVYSISSNYEALNDYGYYTVNFSREGDPNLVLDIILKELDILRKEPISEEELQSIKRFSWNEFKEELIDRKKLAEKLITYELGMGGVQEYHTFPSYISKVNVDDISRVANKWMNIDNLTITRLAPIKG